MLVPFLVIGLIGLCLTALILASRPDHVISAICRKLCVFFAVLLLLALVSSASAWGQPPERSLKYKDYLKVNAKIVWGPEAPIALFAGQIHQESAWNPEARS